jgi:serine protease Do
VLAVSCQTGELELVGIFHARYNNASALNVVVAIDQVRHLMATLERTPRPAPTPEPDAAARARLAEAIHRATDPPFFAVGSYTASVAARPDGALVFSLYSPEFPRVAQPLVVVEDLPPAAEDGAAFGRLGAVSAASAGVLHGCVEADLDAETSAAFARTLALFRQDALAAYDERAAEAAAGDSRDAYQRAAKRKRVLVRTLDAQQEVVRTLVDKIGRLAAKITAAK